MSVKNLKMWLWSCSVKLLFTVVIFHAVFFRLFFRRSCRTKSPAWSTTSTAMTDVSRPRVISFQFKQVKEELPVLFLMMMVLMVSCSLQSFCTWRASCRHSNGSGRASTGCGWTSSSRWVWGESCTRFRCYTPEKRTSLGLKCSVVSRLLNMKANSKF